MLDLNDFRYFVEVVDRNGFSAAGRTLGIPTSTMSYRIRQLEQNLGVGQRGIHFAARVQLQRGHVCRSESRSKECHDHAGYGRTRSDGVLSETPQLTGVL